MIFKNTYSNNNKPLLIKFLMNSTEVYLRIQDVISSKKHVYFFHLYSKILCFSNFLSCQTTLFVCHQTKENLTCVGRGRCPQLEIDIHSNSRLDNDFHSTLVVYRKSFPIYGVAEKHGIGEKQKKKEGNRNQFNVQSFCSGGHITS